MLKRYLLAPGPTPVPSEALLAMAMPIVHHRSPDFLPILDTAKKAYSGFVRQKTMCSSSAPQEPGYGGVCQQFL